MPLPVQAAEHEQDFVLVDLNLFATLGLSERFALELRQPLRYVNVQATFLDDQGRVMPGFTSIHHRDETLVGPGDTEVGGRFRILRPKLGQDTTLDATFGVSLPVGKTEDNPFALGRRGLDHQHIQFGSGTFDPLAGFELSHGFGAFSLVGWASGRASLYENSHGFQSGARIAAGVSAASGFGLQQWQFTAGPELYHEQPSQWNDEPEPINSGRTDVIASAGVFFLPSAAFEMHAIVKKPFTVRALGGQLDIPFTFVLGASINFGVFGEASHEHGEHEHGEHEHGEHEHGKHAHGEHEHAASKSPSVAPPAEPLAQGGDVRDVARGGESFRVEQAVVIGKVTVVDFWATWCVPCEAIDRMLRELAAEHRGLAVRRVEVVDLDSPVAVEHLKGAQALPVVWIFDERGKQVEKLEATSVETVRERLERYLKPQ